MSASCDTSVGAGHDGGPDVLLLRIGAELHAVHLRTVREVVPHASVTPVPGAPAWLDGLVNLRGDVLPVVDSGRCLGAEGAAAPTHLVVSDTAGGPAALVAMGTPVPGRLGDRVGPGLRPGARAQHLSGEEVCTLLDLDAMTGQGSS